MKLSVEIEIWNYAGPFYPLVHTGLNTEGWCKRIENNGWRLASTRVSEILLNNVLHVQSSEQLENGLLMQDTVTSATKQTTFHHLKVVP